MTTSQDKKIPLFLRRLLGGGFLLICLFHPLAFGASLLNDSQEEEQILSDKWISGSWLIYDCDALSWVCVNEINFKTCQDLRQSSWEKSTTWLTCLPLSHYQTQARCRLMSHANSQLGYVPRECYAPEVRSRFH
jgi:hypothetical protein